VASMKWATHLLHWIGYKNSNLKKPSLVQIKFWNWIY